MATRETFERQLIELVLDVLRKLSGRPASATPPVYLAFSIGPEMLAVRVHELDVQNDEDALEKAMSLFHDGLEHLEVWCGSRKVGDIPGDGDGDEAYLSQI
jgi:hypothetical protein